MTNVIKFVLTAMLSSITLAVSSIASAQPTWAGIISDFVSPPKKTVVLLIDVTSSINDDDRIIYHRSTADISKNVKLGDKLIVAKIGDIGRGRFVSTFEGAVESSGHPREDDFKLEQMRRKFSAATQGLIAGSQNSSHQATYLFDALAGVSESLQRSMGDKSLVLLTDGLEQSAQWNFDGKTKLDEAGRKKVLADVKRLGLLPNLTGVKVYVAGLSGNAKRFDELRTFWTEYFQAAGADIRSIGRDAVTAS